MYQILKHRGCYSAKCQLLESGKWQVTIYFPTRKEYWGNGYNCGNGVGEYVQETDGATMRQICLNITEHARRAKDTLENKTMHHMTFSVDRLRGLAQKAISNRDLGFASDVVNLMAWYGSETAESIYLRQKPMLVMYRFWHNPVVIDAITGMPSTKDTP